MNTTKIVALSLVTCMIFAGTLVFLGGVTDAENEVHVEENPVVIIGCPSAGAISEALNSYTNVISISNDVAIEDNVMYMVNGDSLYENPTIADDLTQAAYNGNPVVIIGNNYDPLVVVGESLGMNMFMPDMQAYGIHYDVESNTEYVYAVAGFSDENGAIAEMYRLMNTPQSNSNDVLEGVSGFRIYTFTYACDDFGKISSRTEYSVIEDTSDDYNFYLAHYKLQGIPNGGHSKSMLGVEADVNADSTYGQYQTLLDYGPTTSSGTTTVGFSAGIGAGYEPLTVTAGFQASWSYALDDVFSIDRSDFEGNYFNVDYDINECTPAGYNTLLVQPGLVASASESGDGNYHVVDHYRAQFCNVVLHGAWHNDFRNYSHPVEVVIYG